MKDLLLLLAHYPFDTSKKEILAGLLKEITDWDSFVKLVNAHGIIALAAYNIREAGLVSLIPAKAMAILENGLMQSMIRNAWLAERWKEVNEILNEAGIRHILLKGMALEHTIYGARGLRQMTDCDILIKRQDALKAWKILQKYGFTRALLKSHLHLRILPEAPLHLPALYRDNYALEIHTKIFGETVPDLPYYNSLFDSPEEINISGHKAFVLPHHAHEKYLLIHYTWHLKGGECQIRTWQDLRIMSPENLPPYPEEFIPEPDQKRKKTFRKRIFREKIRSLSWPYSFLYLAGDLFPSVKWMKSRYKCSMAGALIRYPHRLGKLLWLI